MSAVDDQATRAAQTRDPNKNDLTIYDAVADQWWSGETAWVRTLANMVPARMRFFDKIVAGSGGWRGMRVLDLGCAGGFMSEALAERGATVSGIDPAAAAIASASRHAKATDLEIDYRVGVGEALPYPDAAFDHVVCVDVLEHVEDLGKVLDEVRRVLKPGGFFLFDTINRNGVASFVVVTAGENLLGLLPKGTHDPAMFIKPAELSEALTRRGFEMGRLRGLGPAGVNRRFDFTFAILPSTTIIYIGSAQRGRD